MKNIIVAAISLETWTEGNNESIVIEELGPQELEDRRNHENFLAEELRPEQNQFE
jgi:hypothetical protein